MRLDTAENWKLKLKTEKYCSKIIFKCMNSIVGPIFNEKVVKKCILWDPWTVHKSTVHVRKVKKIRLDKKKKKKKILKRKRASGKRKTRFPNALLASNNMTIKRILSKKMECNLDQVWILKWASTLYTIIYTISKYFGIWNLFKWYRKVLFTLFIIKGYIIMFSSLKQHHRVLNNIFFHSHHVFLNKNKFAVVNYE